MRALAARGSSGAAAAAPAARRGARPAAARPGAAARPECAAAPVRPGRRAAAAGAAPPASAAAPGAAAAAAGALPGDVKCVLFSAEQIAGKVAELGAAIAADHAGVENVAIIGVLNGAFIFTSDLARCVSAYLPDVKVDFLRASSYGAASESSGAVSVKGAGSALAKWAGYHIVLVEDIIDTGHTLARLSALLADAGAPSVKVVALLDKKGRRRVECFPDYVGWDCPNEFVVGYGLDFNERFRCLPYVAALKEEAYSCALDGH
ncbi:hpt [Scenedesmus sp. PABB004]|nr:hpt [Scenedesmus sp. PABB004]